MPLPHWELLDLGWGGVGWTEGVRCLKQLEVRLLEPLRLRPDVWDEVRCGG